jgi:DNA-binding NtrC family response regulator
VIDALDRNGWIPVRAGDLAQAHALYAEHTPLAGVVVLPQQGGSARIAECRHALRSLAFIRWIGILGRELLASDDVQRLVVHGLHDFQTYPLDTTRLTVILGHAYGLASMEAQLQEKQRSEPSGRFGLVGDSPAMRSLFRSIRLASAADVTVLITGPTGTGKELVARAIHTDSPRGTAPFVALSCAAIPPSLLQSELFGHERGAFTGASERRIGHIQAAAGGTLFLDEIGEMPLESQAVLLRFLEEKRVTRLGGRRSEKVDVRVIAATNKDLEMQIRDGAFRADLFYRLAVLTIRTPTLKSRGGDIELLAKHFLTQAIESTRAPILGFSEDALWFLGCLDWPGNVRELRSRVLQAVLACSGPLVTKADFESGSHFPSGSNTLLGDARLGTEKQTLERALAGNRWNVAATAQALGVSRMTLYRLLKRHGLSRDATL